MGKLHSIGTAFAIIAVVLHGPEIQTEGQEHLARERIFKAAAKYALSAAETQFVLDHKDQNDKLTYYLGLMSTASRPIGLLFNDARDFFQNKVFLSGKPNPEYKLHLGLLPGETIFQQ